MIKKLQIIIVLMVFYGCTKAPSGKVTQYWENDSVKITVEFENGFKNGDEVHYYPSGNIEKKLQWHNDTLIYQQNYYYDSIRSELLLSPNGDTVVLDRPIFKKFTFVDWDGQVAFEQLFDEEGRLISQKGNAIIEVTEADITKQSNEEYKLIILLAIPPYIHDKSLLIKEFNGDSLRKEKLVEIDYEINRAYYLFKPANKKANTLRLIYTYESKDQLQRDSLTVIIPRKYK